MENKNNINLINQYQNQELYEDNIFDFILIKTDLKELKNTQFEISYQKKINIKGNFEAFLYKRMDNNNSIVKIMYEKIKKKWNNELLNPLYFIKFKSKDYILEQPGYEIFTNINNYLKKKSENKINNLSDTEEKFVIDWFLKDPPQIYLQSNQTKEINELYQILLNQKEYLNKRNDKSAINNFFENHGMKKILSLFSQEQKENLMSEKLSYQEIIKSYYNNLLRQNQFDLAAHLYSFNSKDIISYLNENISDKPEEWFKVFLEKGSALTFNELDNKLLLSPKKIYEYKREKNKNLEALKGGIELFKKLQPELQNEDLIKRMFVTTIEAESENLYLEIRKFTELPQDEKFIEYINQKTIHKKSISIIEKEILKNKLENKFESKPKSKQNKI